MDVFRDGRFESDSWQRIDDDAAVPATGPVLVSLTRWRAERDRLTERDAALGLVIAPGDSLDGLADDLGETSRFAVIAIAFPAFTDGRGYSHARILRERHGYAGELRAIGEILIDQIPFMMRVGIDAFRVTDEPTRRRLAEGGVPGVTRHTQPGSSREGRAAGWSWRRHRPAG